MYLYLRVLLFMMDAGQNLREPCISNAGKPPFLSLYFWGLMWYNITVHFKNQTQGQSSEGSVFGHLKHSEPLGGLWTASCSNLAHRAEGRYNGTLLAVRSFCKLEQLAIENAPVAWFIIQMMLKYRPQILKCCTSLWDTLVLVACSASCGTDRGGCEVCVDPQSSRTRDINRSHGFCKIY